MCCTTSDHAYSSQKPPCLLIASAFGQTSRSSQGRESLIRLLLQTQPRIIAGFQCVEQFHQTQQAAWRFTILGEKPVHETIIILDFGSQYTQLIARRVREAGVYCEILPYDASPEAVRAKKPQALILSGGPSSVYEEGAPRPAPGLLEKAECPVLGICYGIHLLASEMGGEVRPSSNREYGYARLSVTCPESPLFSGLPQEMVVWLSHGDHITRVPEGFRITAYTDGTL